MHTPRLHLQHPEEMEMSHRLLSESLIADIVTRLWHLKGAIWECQLQLTTLPPPPSLTSQRPITKTQKWHGKGWFIFKTFPSKTVTFISFLFSHCWIPDKRSNYSYQQLETCMAAAPRKEMITGNAEGSGALTAEWIQMFCNTDSTTGHDECYLWQEDCFL